jgi:site-specific recombinase XerC
MIHDFRKGRINDAPNQWHMLSFSLTEEHDHAGSSECDPRTPEASAVEQGKADRGEAAAATQTRLSEQTRQAIDDYLKATNKRPGEFLFTGRRGAETSLTTRQYARLVSEWIGSVGLDPRLFGTHSLRRTKATLIYRRTGNLRAVQLLLGHTKIEKYG